MHRDSLWLLLQLADGSFPSGGFAHSYGLEAALAFGGADQRLEDFLDDQIEQTGAALLPFVRAACAVPSLIAELDFAIDATIPLPVPNRASRAQGRALASAASRIFDVPAIVEHARSGPAHHPIVFGALFGSLDIDARSTLAAYLHGATRGVLSAAVRLNVVGPLEAQRFHADRAALLDATLERALDACIDDVAQTAPLLELYAALHDRLDARMFQS